MFFRANKYISFLLLFIFLFPFIEKEIHTVLHKDDTHCDIKTEQHYHEKEHKCSICDFNITTSFTLSHFTSYTLLQSANDFILGFHKEIFTAAAFCYFSLRAPPLFS